MQTQQRHHSLDGIDLWLPSRGHTLALVTRWVRSGLRACRRNFCPGHVERCRGSTRSLERRRRRRLRMRRRVRSILVLLLLRRWRLLLLLLLLLLRWWLFCSFSLGQERLCSCFLCFSFSMMDGIYSTMCGEFERARISNLEQAPVYKTSEGLE